MAKMKIKISKSQKVSPKEAAKMRKRPGGSNVGKYKNVSKDDFAGPAGGAPSGSYPIPTLSKAKSALKLAHFAPKPSAIRAKVYKKFPSLKPKIK